MSDRIADYDFFYPPELVAQDPLKQRDASRMMVLTRNRGKFKHGHFRELPEYLREGDLLVANDTALTACRLYAKKPTGALVEVFVLASTRPLEHRVWFSPLKSLKEGQRLRVFSRSGDETVGPEVEVLSLREDEFRIRFFSAEEESVVLAEWGEMPTPPYIRRAAPKPEDRERYQTIFARQAGAVAAPTAGLHFTPELQALLKERGVGWAQLTLHVGPGTFLPVKTDRLDAHRMHRESYEIPEETQVKVKHCLAGGGRVIPIGTTSLRAVEAWAMNGEARGETDLFIRPGFKFQLAAGLLTNFHQPRSTLLVLVSALAGRDFILSAYQEAIRDKYRLFSYGDCMLIL